jgi:Protein of unknown function (DUF3592)
MAGLFLDIYVVYVFRIFWRLANLLRSRKWTKATATVLGSHPNLSNYNSVRVDYEYAVKGQKYADSFTKPFILDSSVKGYAEQFARGMEFKIRVKPSDQSVSVADSSVENW